MATVDKKSKGKNIESIYPLSPMQQGMLFHTLYAPETGVYFQQLSCTLQGSLNIEAFEQAWQRVVERHSVLRTAFIWENPKQSFQVVCKLVNIPWVHHDWRSLSANEQQDALEAFLQADRDQGFELKQVPLMRCTLIQVADNTYKFIWSHHHLLIDGWSLPTIVQEVFAFYDAFNKGENLHLKAPRPYEDYITWLKKQDDFQAELYWQETLKGFTVPTPLTVEIPLTKRQQQSNYNSQQIKITEIAQIQTFTKQHKLTLNNLIQGAWALLLSRYSGETDVVFGATVSGRPPDLLRVESMVGLFINTLPVRITIPEDVEVLAWLKNLQAQQVESEQYSYSPLVEIQGKSEIPRGMPLFESIVVFENYPVDASVQEKIANLDISDIRCIEQTNYPLTVLAVPGSELSISISYDTSRFEATTITRMLRHLQTLLTGIVTQPNQCVWELPLLTESEQNQLLQEYQNTETTYLQDKCIHELFELQVEQTPNAIAVVFENQQLTYEQLNTRANQLAHYLRTLGVGADTLVGICIERSLEMIVGILGILKAGGAYVPLDPNYPQERLSFTLSDSQVKVLLTQQQLLPNLPSHQAQVLCIDADWELVAQQNQQNPPIITAPANLAYIIYTSGSTGKPKGVLINHANVVRLFIATEEWFHFNQQDVWTLFHSYAFDFSVWEIWGALIKGGRLVIVPYWISRSPKDFYQLLSTQKVTVLNQTPSAFRQLIQAEELIDAPANLALRWVIFGGEALELQSLKPWFERHTDKSPQLVNMYGITETTVHVTYRPITIADLSSNAGSVIGSPIPDLQVYVLDKKRQLLPIGVPGEMYVGGAGLARGYFNRQELTSNVFVVHPFNKDPNARLYKTGDLARYLSNDDLEYLGRIDNQVKIRGFRIELGEIEAAISQHHNIQATVVVAREDTPGDKRLVAYLVLHQQQAVSVKDLRQFLSSKLPQYMIPSAFVFLETLPLTSNGKVDRRALPAPESRRELEVSFVAARTPNEQMLATIWAEVLRVEQVGIYDNFFELGGDSILSLQIIARANQAGLQLSPKQLFEHQAIVQLATVVSTAKKIQAQQGLATGQLPLTPIQQWFFEQNQPEPHHYNQSVLLEVPSDLKPELLKRVLQQLLLHHDALRLQFMLKDKGWQAVNADFAEAVSLNVVDLSTISQKEQLAALEIVGGELQASLNLSTGPIMGAALFQLGTDQSSRLLLVIHHLSVDSVSWRILLNDLQTAYQQLSRSEVMQLPTKTTSFKYWAQRLSEYAQSEALTGELAYWLNSSQKPVLPIPVDHEQGKNTVISASMVSVSLNATQTQALLQEVPRAYNTQINDVLLTALVPVLSKWAGSNLVRLNLEGHGREDIFDDVDLSRTVGWFTTIFPVLLDVEASDNLGTILKSVKEQLRRIPHKGIGYGVLRYLHQNEEITNQLQTSLQAEISFNYLGQFDQALDTSAGFKLANEPVGASQSWQSERVHLLEIGGFISQGQLQIDWTYSSNIHQKSTIENLANEFIQALQALIAHCLSPENGGYTPSDFPLAKLTQTQLDAELGKTNWQNVADIYPLSPMQQGMLFHSLYAPESGVYFTQLSWTLTGNLNVPAFEQAWQQVVARHTILRTAFIWESLSQPLQIVYEKVNITIQTDDWRKLSAQQQQQQLEVFVESERQQSFQLSQAPLMRLHLLQLDRNTYQFIWSHHHLLLDGWSLPLVFQDLLDLYQAICQSKSLPLQRTISYRNYIAWLQQQNIAQAKEFWQQKLQGFSVPTPLTVDKPLSNREQNSSYSEQQIQLTVAVTTAVESFARQHQLTLNNLVQASWALLLSRYSQETDVVFGATVSGRPPTLSGVESMVGLFINTLPVRVQISEKTQLLDLLKDLQTQQIESEQFSYSSLVDIQGLSDVPRGRSLFESIVVFENYPVDRAVSQDDDNLSISHIRGIEQTNYPLTFVAVPGKQLFLKVSYDNSRFEDGTISRMLGHLVTLLSAIVANPQERISQLPLLTATEQQQVIVEWNDTEVEYPQEQCIHQLFEKQVELNPQAVAVVFEDQQLTYLELNQRANQLGHHLRTLGVKPDVLVGICVERSLSMVVGLLGILKAGGAYVPLDPDYPQERLAYMLEDAQVSVLLTQQKLVEQLPQHQAKLVCLDNDWNLINQGSQDNLRSGVQLSNLAYVIYTSGSTGQPKGVMNTHAGISNRLFWMQDTYKLTPTDCVLQKTPFSFDVSVWEFFWPLLNGIRLVIAQPGGHQDSNYLINLIAAQKITTVHFVPSMLQVFLQEQELKACKSLRQVICSGEALPFEIQKRFFTGLDAELHNLYGPTEAAIDVTFWQCERNSNQQIVPIGRPIANTQIYVLDRYLQPVPIGVPGELHIGGAGLARGYLNRPELTAEKFIRNPWSQDPDSRFYKTGDLARYLPNGNIEYLGRIDYQVKIRGFRIELGEIEASLSQHPDVLSVVVIAREDIPGDKRLIAYLVVNQQLTPNISQLRQFLMQKLPEYMIPSAFVYLDSLPLTPNGKVDRRNLPAPEFNRQLEVGYVAPRNPVEEMLAQIWADVLRVEQVGIHDNFFELGGDSILSIQIISRAKLAGVQLTVKQLFANQKIAQLSTVVGTTLALQIEQELVTGTLPLTPIQHWFFEQDLPEKHHFNQSLLLSVPSDIKPEILEQAWQQLLVHHDALRLRFKQTDLTWQQMHAAPTGVVFSFFNISTLREPELQAAIETTANTLQASLNLSENLVQVGFFFLGIDKEARLLIVIHHLVVDGVSWRILLEDLQTAYEQISQGKAIKLPPKTTSFKDWAQKLREYAQSEVLKSELGYWLSASESWVSPLPRLRQGVNSVASAKTISVSLNQTETQALLQYVPKAYKTQINDVLLTALVLVVSRWTNSSSVIFNLEGHGREEIVDGVDLSRTIGWFTTIFPVLVTLDVTDNLGTTLKSVKEQLRAIPNKGIAYGLLRYLNLDPEIKFQLERIPEAEISFNYLGQVLNTTSSLMQLARESRGNSVSLQGQRSHLLDVNAIITDEELEISWTYSSNVHQHETIENIAQEFVETLREIIAHCLSPENGGYTPSDFPLAKLTQTQLDAELGKTNWQNVADIYPLSPMQQGMLFHSLYAPESGVYFTQLSWTLTGNLNVPAFEQAWQQVVARHTILRTAFIWESLSQPLQIVYEKVNITIQTDDWRKLSAQQQQQQLEVFVESERQQSFQLSQAPLMRLHLLQLDRNTYQFIWSHHHLLLDGWSLPLVFQDLLDLYQAICQSKSLPLQRTISYRNYIAWLQQQNIAQAKEFWQQKLQGFSVPTPLTVDKPLSNREQNSSYSEQQIQLTVAVTTAVESFARQHQLTLNNLVQASWALLLSRYSQETDVVFGATVSGRPPTLSGVESMVGLFINTLPVRVQISEKTQLLDLLKDLQTQQIESEQFSYSSLVDIQGLSDVPRGRSLFESIVVFENYPVDRAVSQDDDNLSISHIRGIEQTNYPLTFVAVPGKQLFLKVSYDNSRFEDGTISRMLGHLVTLLSAIVANPQERISQLPLLTATEQQQVIVEWNDTEVEYPQEQCIHQLFEKQVELNPQAVAVVFEDQQLTYLELNQRANQLGHHLRTLGVKPDVLVGICVERSLSMVVGLLGILKAGGAYVPLDPDYPQERLAYMLEDAQVSVLLTQQKLVEQLPQHQAKLVCLDNDWNLINQGSQDNLRSGVQLSNLAYVIYTSGSTGQPKGVMNTHAGISNRLFWMQDTYKLTPTDCVLQKTPFSFDVSVWEFFWPLLNGIRLVIAQPGGHQDSNYLINLIAAQKITTVHFVPSMLQVFLQEQELKACKSLRQVICSGEALPFEIQKRFFTGLDAELHNLYGPTEAAIDVTFWQCERNSNQQIVPIGRPIANTQIYVLDRYLQPVPIGVPGELHIGGAGLARGYLNRPELTAEKFIRNPWSQDPDSRFYKTGDLARYLPNGNIEYLGRIDYQVKIRGFRIELGEIEASLSQHPDVLSVVVIAREDIPGDKRLIAYLVVNQQLTPNISQLRQFLMQKLPEYMIPSAFVYLDSLPLTPNGKVDRRNLPAPEFNRQLEVGYVAPRNPVEEMLAQIWADVLRVEQVGIHDNFFELGGDSILSIQIISRAKLAGVQLTVKQLFANQKIAQLSTVVGTTLALQIEQELVTGTLPLTPIQHWFFEQDLPEKHHFNQSLLLSVPSDIKPEILEQAWQQLLVHHDALRLRFKQTDLTWQQMHAAPTGVVFSFFNISTLREPELQAAIETTANTLQASLNLSENLVQVGFFFLGIDKEARLLIVIHHLVVDGVSWRILLEDLQTAYEQISQGKAIKLPPKTTSFKDWAQKLREYAQSEVLKSELGYWLSASESWVSPLPRLRQGVNSVASAKTISVSLNQTETQALLQYVPKAYKTQINDVLLTALVLVVSRWTNSSSVIFNLEGHGREEIVDGVDLSRTIGWFTTIFPVLVTLDVTDNLGTTLKSVKEQLRAIPNKGIAYGLLRYLNLDPEIKFQLERIPEAEISFNYLGQVLNTTSSLMQLARESRGNSVSLQGQRSHLLDVNAIITDEELEISWTYSSNVHQHETIENIAQEFVETLREIIAHCLSPENGGYTPSDFPLAKLTQTQLDAELGKTNWQNVADIYPLSPMQQGMLFHSLYAPESGVYFTQLSWTLTGNLNVPAFEQAWQQVVARHTILRTAFIWESLSQPLQIVYEKVNITIQTDDWRKLSAQQQQQQLEVFVESERQQSFQLSQAPLMRLHLLQLDRNTYQFIWSHHHLLLDGWSLPLVFQDLLDLYQAICQSKSLPLQRTISYRNYIAWLQQQNIAQAKEFWQQKLQGFSVPTPLTVDKPLSNREQNSSYSEQQIQLTVAVTTAVESFARQHQLTLNNLVQASWALLLSRYSQETDVVFGATVSGRPPTLSGVESMVGLFINTLPVRVQISEKTQLLDLLKDLQTQQIESEQFSYSSLVDIQGLSDVPRGRSLFESIVVFENYPVDRAVSQDDDNLSISHIRGIEQTNYPLTFVAVPGKQLFLKVSYDNSRFEDGTISRMLGHLVTLLSAIVANPQERISQLPLLTATEQQQVIVEWNDTEVEYPQEQCIHQLFEKQVELNPQAVAVVFEDQQLTYLELNQRANQLGHHLRTLGVKPDVLVGICVERSLSMVVGLLGILKAGGAYVPLDPDYPQERLAYMLEDAQVSVLLTQQKLLAEFSDNSLQIVCLDCDWQIISQQQNTNLINKVNFKNLAYIIYTSGSTGKPKGVMAVHKGLLNLISWHQSAFGVTAQDRATQLAGTAFDASAWELWPYLSIGAAIYLVSPEIISSPVSLQNWLVSQKISITFVPTPLAEALLSLEWQPENLALRIMLTGGDKLHLYPSASIPFQLVNNYGPTENTVVTTSGLVVPNAEVNKLPNIGRVISNVQVYILDNNSQPVPIGVPGELHIGGAGLARGYLNRPELTAEKFIRNPWSQDPDSQLYKTGDLARYLPNGNIEYLGRIDYQVKIRGFRIELGEIEASLSQHPDVLSVVVIAREDIPGDKRLIAYLVVNQQLTPNISQLRQFLMQKLPEYMIPSAFVYLDSLPLTPNGKVDRRNLPAPEFNRQLEVGYVAPRNPVEEMLAQIWADVLRVEQVGIHDNFFSLGGHSLLATQLVSQVREVFSVELPLDYLFKNPTIAALSEIILTQLVEQSENNIIEQMLNIVD